MQAFDTGGHDEALRVRPRSFPDPIHVRLRLRCPACSGRPARCGRRRPPPRPASGSGRPRLPAHPGWRRHRGRTLVTKKPIGGASCACCSATTDSPDTTNAPKTAVAANWIRLFFICVPSCTMVNESGSILPHTLYPTLIRIHSRLQEVGLGDIDRLLGEEIVRQRHGGAGPHRRGRQPPASARVLPAVDLESDRGAGDIAVQPGGARTRGRDEGRVRRASGGRDARPASLCGRQSGRHLPAGGRCRPVDSCVVLGARPLPDAVRVSSRRNSSRWTAPGTDTRAVRTCSTRPGRRSCPCPDTAPPNAGASRLPRGEYHTAPSRVIWILGESACRCGFG